MICVRWNSFFVLQIKIRFQTLLSIPVKVTKPTFLKWENFEYVKQRSGATFYIISPDFEAPFFVLFGQVIDIDMLCREIRRFYLQPWPKDWQVGPFIYIFHIGSLLSYLPAHEWARRSGRAPCQLSRCRSTSGRRTRTKRNKRDLTKMGKRARVRNRATRKCISASQCTS